MKKKAQGISVNVIIIAAIALIVLVVLVAVFTGRMGWFSELLGQKEKGLKCAEQGGTWENTCEDKIQLYGVADAEDKAGKLCCKPK